MSKIEERDLRNKSLGKCHCQITEIITIINDMLYVYKYLRYTYKWYVMVCSFIDDFMVMVMKIKSLAIIEKKPRQSDFNYKKIKTLVSLK